MTVIPGGKESIMREGMVAGRHDSWSSAERSHPGKHIVSRQRLHSLKASPYWWMPYSKATSHKPHQTVKLTWNQVFKYLNQLGIFHSNNHILVFFFISICASEKKKMKSYNLLSNVFTKWATKFDTQEFLHTQLCTLACTHKMHKLNTKSGIGW